MLAFVGSMLAYVGARRLLWAYVGPCELTLGFVGSMLGFWGLRWPTLAVVAHAGCRTPTLVHVSEGGVWWWFSWVWVGLDWLWVDVARNASGTPLEPLAVLQLSISSHKNEK